MALARLLGATAALAGGVYAHSKDYNAGMGALGVVWPPDRAWSESEAQTAPCGGADRVANRTDFPLMGGSLQFEQTEEVYDIETYLSLAEDPRSNDDFELISFGSIPSLDFASVCLAAPDLPAANPDQKATLQFRYVASFHTHKRHPSTNETFYLCSDVTLIPPNLISEDEAPCFNASSEERGGHTDDGQSRDGENAGQEGEGGGQGGGGKLSGGAVAGIVVGCVAGVALFAGAAWFFWRRRAAKGGEAQRQMAADKKAQGLSVSEGE